ncbi:MAG: OsmC family protein [Anaerolineae bacterium]|nr:OsmC family protein [Anaerolineae bacterium]
MSNKVKVELVSGMHLNGFSSAFDAPIPLDSDEAVGGQGKGHRPLEMLLLGLGGCMTMDTISILRKKQQKFDTFEVEFETERAADHPRIYTKIKMHFVVKGEHVTEEALARALELSYTKYCPANAMLALAAEITYTYEVISPISEPGV